MNSISFELADVDNGTMRNMIQWMSAGLVLLLATSCATVGEPPEVIVILPEDELIDGEAATIDFSKQIKPILLGKCLSCHHSESEVTDISFASRGSMLKASRDRPILVPGKPEKSTLFLVTVLPDYFIEAMPASGHQLTEEEKWNLYHWILQGANWPKGEGELKSPKKKKKMVAHEEEERFLVGQGD